ncbi:hypothetical protein chiPu_0027416, partial [Chiloscyllium punctatum]|nr:hypothetical protein [Chiloscyllium punctatum]
TEQLKCVDRFLEDIMRVSEILSTEVALSFKLHIDEMSNERGPQEEEAERDGEQQNNGPLVVSHLWVLLLPSTTEHSVGSVGR